MKNKNVIVYTRVSTDEQAQQGYSLQHQEVTATAYCNLKEYNILNLYKEDYSAKSFIRPEWEKVMEFIKANKGKYLFLKEADLRCANLYRANLCGAEYNDNTIFPEGFTIPKEMIKI